MKSILRKDWNYILYDNYGSLLISVICGTVGLFERNINLNNEELELYQKGGELYLDSLAEEIRSNPNNYNSRHVIVE